METTIFIGYIVLSITLFILFICFKSEYDKKLEKLDSDITIIWGYLDSQLRMGASPSPSISPSPSPESIDNEDEYSDDNPLNHLPSGSYPPSGFPVSYPTECKYCGWPIGEELLCTHCGAPKYRK